MQMLKSSSRKLHEICDSSVPRATEYPNKSIGNKDVQCKTDLPPFGDYCRQIPKMWGRVVYTSIYAIHEHCQEWEGLKCKRTADWRAAQHRAGVHCCADSHTGHSLHSQGNKALKNLDLTYHVELCWFGFANYSTQEWQNTHRNPGGLIATPVLSYSENSPVSTSFTTNVPALQHTEAAAVLWAPACWPACIYLEALFGRNQTLLC